MVMTCHRPPITLMAMSDVTQILARVERGDPAAAAELLPLVYDELRKLAAHKMAQEQPGHTLQATALLHEAYLRLVDVGHPQSWDSRGHFFAAAAEAMRRILIDQARRKQADKRGGLRQRVPYAEELEISLPDAELPSDLLDLDEALRDLEVAEPDKAALVKLRYFAGLALEDAAQVLGISLATAKRRWVYARAWLYGKLEGSKRPEEGPQGE